MPTINEVIERVNKVKPDVYDDSTKAEWLLDLEGKIYFQIILTHEQLPQKTQVYSAQKNAPDDWSLPLIVDAPYDNLYDLYLIAQIDFHNREMDNYNNSALAFNEAFDQWQKHYHQTHMPVSAGGFKNIW